MQSNFNILKFKRQNEIITVPNTFSYHTNKISLNSITNMYMKTHTISEQVNLFVKKVFESFRSCQYPNYHMMLISFLSFRSEFCTLGLPKLSILEASLHFSTFETVLHSIFNDETRQLPHNCSTSITQTYKHLHLYVFSLQKQSMIC